MGAQATFTWGSGDTTVGVWVQTSFDGGLNWCDVIGFANFAVASARAVAMAVQGNVAPVVNPSDGGGTTPFANSLFGSWWRVKYIVAGAYVSTTLRVDAFTNVGLVPAGVNAFN